MYTFITLIYIRILLLNQKVEIKVTKDSQIK
jgi:hypothetical protein